MGQEQSHPSDIKTVLPHLSPEPPEIRVEYDILFIHTQAPDGYRITHFLKIPAYEPANAIIRRIRDDKFARTDRTLGNLWDLCQSSDAFDEEFQRLRPYLFPFVGAYTKSVSFKDISLRYTSCIEITKRRLEVRGIYTMKSRRDPNSYDQYGWSRTRIPALCDDLVDMTNVPIPL